MSSFVKAPSGAEPQPVDALVASLRALIADLRALQPPEALHAFELAAVGRYVARRPPTRVDLDALGAELAARNAELIRQTRLLH